jgi:hypothetical protein
LRLRGRLGAGDESITAGVELADRGGAAGAPGAPDRRGRTRSGAIVGLGVALVMTTIMVTTYVQSQRGVVAHNLPWGQVGQSPLTAQVQKSVSLDLKTYPSQSAMEQAARETKLYAVVAGLVFNLIVGPILGAYPDVGTNFWPLWGEFALMIFAVALLTATLQSAIGPVGTLVAVISSSSSGTRRPAGRTGPPISRRSGSSSVPSCRRGTA